MERFSIGTLNQRMAQLQNDPDYQANCQRFAEECSRLENIAQELYAHRDTLIAHCQTNTVRKVYASGSTLHRGFYCPSPTYDIIVGNTKRGKLLKRHTPHSKPSHEYGFGADDSLLYCNWFRNGTVATTEYLSYHDRTIYGITLDADGHISTITEETYTDGKLVRYLRGLCLPYGESFSCHEIDCEEYEYDSHGLRCCQMHHLTLPPQDFPDFLKRASLPFIRQPIYRSDHFLFERTDGYLSSCSCGTHTYPISIQRKA